MLLGNNSEVGAGLYFKLQWEFYILKDMKILLLLHHYHKPKEQGGSITFFLAIFEILGKVLLVIVLQK